MIIKDDNYAKVKSNYSEVVPEETAWDIYLQALKYRYTNTSKYLMLLEKACEYGSGDAALDLGDYELEKKNYNTALKWYEKATELDKTDGFIRMGNIHWKLEELRKAKACFMAAAELVDPEGMYHLGKFIKKEDRDKYKALYWFEKSANLEHRNGKRAVISSPNNMAELLGVIMHGKLLKGDRIWRDGIRDISKTVIDYGVVNEKLLCLQELNSTIKEEILSNNQDVIGYTVKNNHFGANEYFIFTDEAIYIQDENGEENGIWYKLIEDVKVNESDLLIMHHGGSIFEVPNGDEWIQILEEKRLRLFLLVAANITHEWIDDGQLLIEGKHVFSIQERIQLSNVRLNNLEGKSVLWAL
ncbi:Tetratricopeptide repeat-containing protein [Selenomonas ruminantium]|uniref:Tetratricopeptide repeat-containing protein n=1 Tax=Selenomonas ruminantium TaxID=971 RepID=A0A1M6TP58_SELRU|nr:SEL1-like repeat protein [Selenomonas ruminantium]SHK58727.1 Tetratricopeptide repeat-containing protein [Selenomonas ruminantium]